ncbi:MAG TPA: ABC transporter ATP-binding protein [Candidatus Limnocylindria bacterium]
MSAALEAVGITKSFGGIRAVSDVTLAVEEGSITAIIGPNGAGKTTLFNVLTSLYRPEAGEAKLFGARVDGLDQSRIAELGLIRTFQTARVFPGMTVLENALVGAHRRLRASLVQQLIRAPRVARTERALVDEALALLDVFGLRARADEPATDLSVGSQKLLELVRALVAHPRVLLLDEPAAGLNDAETEELAASLLAIRDAGITLVVVEHNMSLVMGIADRIAVLDLGAVLAEGVPSAVRADPRVIAAYLGEARS